MELTEYYDEVEGLDAVVLAVSADDLAGASRAAEDWGPPFPILYNRDRSVITDYGVLLGNIANPATFVIDKNGVIRWKYVGDDKRDRPTPGEVLEALRGL